MKPLPFDYRVIRSNRKTVAIYVRNGEAEVRAPNRAPAGYIDDFLQQKSTWIMKKLAEQVAKAEERLEISEGKTITFLGEPLNIRLSPGGRNHVFIDQGALVIQGRLTGENKAESLFYEWLKQQAKGHMVPRTELLARKLEVDHRLKAVRFRKTKSKWGHCSAQGIIQFNGLIMMAPEPVVDYLITHEVCHLVHMNHSRDYWTLVESLCPDYKRLRRWLKDNGHRFWV